MAGVEEDKDEDEELAFNLFAPTTKSTTSENATPAAPQTIRLRSPTPLEAQDAGFVVAERDQSYFFTGPITDAKKAEYAAVAVTGDTVAAWSKLPCPGCAYPWKVISIPASAAKKALDATRAEDNFLPDEEREQKRKRKGKKARIKTRVKAEKARAKKEMAEKGKEEKEQAMREKNARRNREKKLKKRAKDKAKKAASKTGNGAEGDAQDDANSSHGESAEDSE